MPAKDSKARRPKKITVVASPSGLRCARAQSANLHISRCRVTVTMVRTVTPSGIIVSPPTKVTCLVYTPAIARIQASGMIITGMFQSATVCADNPASGAAIYARTHHTKVPIAKPKTECESSWRRLCLSTLLEPAGWRERSGRWRISPW